MVSFGGELKVWQAHRLEVTTQFPELIVMDKRVFHHKLSHFNCGVYIAYGGWRGMLYRIGLLKNICTDYS
jgi:hypothetical protein